MIQMPLKDNLEINNLFKEKIINELFGQYNSIKLLIKTGLEDKENINIKNITKIIEKIKIIFDEIKNNPEQNIKNIVIYIDNLCQERKINIKLNLEDIIKNLKENELMSEQKNKEIQNYKNVLTIEKSSLNFINEDFKNQNNEFEQLEKIIKENEKNEENNKKNDDELEDKLIGRKRARERRRRLNNNIEIIEIDEETSEEINKKNEKNETKKKN
jgi:hypothetical protein